MHCCLRLSQDFFMVRLLLMCLTVSLCGVDSVSGQNHFPGDTSFEAGPANWLGGASVACDSAPNGKSVLQLSRSYNHSDIVYGLIQPGKTYTLSLWARAMHEPMQVELEVRHVRYGAVGRPLKMALTTQWQNFAMTLPKQDTARDVYLTLTQPQGTVTQIDSLMLHAGNKPLAYEPQQDVVVAISPTGAPGNLLYADEALQPLTVGVSNRTTQTQTGKLLIRTVDWYGRVQNQQQYAITLPAHTAKRMSFDALSSMKKGHFRVHAIFQAKSDTTLASAMITFGVVDHPVQATPQEASFGMHPDTSRVELAALPRIGIKWLRAFYVWKWLEKQPGQYALPQNLFDEASKQQLSVLFSLKVLEGQAKHDWQPGQPAVDFTALQRLAQWLGKNAPDCIKAWEIENEPDLIYPSHLQASLLEAATAYGQVLGVAGKAFAQSSPQIPVVGMATSGNQANSTFINQAHAASGDVYDIMTIHPYTGTRYIGPALRSVAPDAYIRQRMMDMATLTPGKRLWAGEIGWAYDTRESLDSETYRTFSDYVARALILMKSVPQVEKILWFKAQGCFERQHYQYGLWRSEFEPLPAAVFFANVARQLERARAYQPVFESDLRIYTFIDPKDKPFAAAWRYKGHVDQILIDQPMGKVHVTDLLGNAVTLSEKEGKTVIPLSATPVWIRVDDVTPDALVEQLSQTSIDLPPVTLTPFLCDGKELITFVHNNLEQELSVRLAIQNGTNRSLTVQPGMTHSISLGVPPQFANGKLAIQAMTRAGNIDHVVDLGSMLPCRQQQNGGLAMADTLNSQDAILLSSRESIYPPDPNIGWESPKDMSGRFNCAYDDQYFHFAADVTDPVHVQDARNYRAWNGDSLQLALDTLNNAPEGVFDFDTDDVELIAWLGPAGAQLAFTHSDKHPMGTAVPGAIVDITRKGDVTCYRLSIPWDQMGKLTPMNGRIFGMNFIVNQNNGKGRRYWLGLSQGIGEGKYPYLYPKFRLVAQ
jgi:hypothetical protein